MQKYWLLDQHGSDGPTALVYTDGSMHITEVLRFGPDITELEDQQAVWDAINGKLAPTMKPLVTAASINVESVEPHADLRLDSNDGSAITGRAARRGSRQGRSGGFTGGGPTRKGGRGGDR